MKPTKLQQVIVQIVNEVGSVARTNLVKLVYLSDESFFNEFGRQLTEAEYHRQKMGPLPAHFGDIVDEMRGREILISEQPMGNGVKLIHKPGNKPRFQVELSEAERKNVGNTIRLFGKLSKRAILEVVYKTRPMLDILNMEEKEGKQLLGHPITFAAFAPAGILRKYAGMAGDLDFSVRGSRQQLGGRDLEVCHNTLALRQRATRHAFGQPLKS